MLLFKNGGRLVENVRELPDLRNANELFLDFETTSFTWQRYGDFARGGHRQFGVAVTADNHEGAWYIPMRHVQGLWNVDLDGGLAWLRDTLSTCKDWVNHNVKFDAHFADVDGATFNGRLIDTLTLSKLIDSDRDFGRGGYGLDALSDDWLEEDIDEHDQRVQDYLKNLGKRDRKACKDYAQVPADIMGEYACQDVITNRHLWRNLQRRRDPMLERVWDTEIKLTPVLFDMEKAGMPVDVQELRVREYKIRYELSKIEESIAAITGISMQPWNSRDCYELLINHYGLPVLAITDKGEPSFASDVLRSYLGHPDVVTDPARVQVVSMILRARDQHTLLSLFVMKYQEFAVNGKMHCDYNQNVRTGRMSCKRPNMQQCSEDAKELIHPEKGCSFMSNDASQIEFRLIGHYTGDPKVIAAYKQNPDTDFHQLIADMCGISRKPAKTLNFCMGYGGGKAKVVAQLANSMELMGSLGAEVDAMIEKGDLEPSQRRMAFEALCKTKGEKTYDDYHKMLPGLRSMTYQAARVCASRGYVFNEYRRIRRMPEKASWRAFNSLCQSTAADVLKERTVALAPRYNEKTRSLGIDLRGQVHDENLTHGPTEVMRNPEVQRWMVEELENVSVQFLIPIRFECKISEKSWADAGKDENKVKIVRSASNSIKQED